tara:strand:+ start:1234 stop:1917 length:684 start_codon:yes stop_codon:yes gene_type:complete
MGLVNEKLVLKSVYFSLLIQIVSGLIQLYAITFTIPMKYNIVLDVLKLETFVQFIEAAFYSWLAYGIYKLKDVTSKRYFDWMITTPIMLISTAAYLHFLNNKETNKKLKFKKFLLDYKDVLGKIFIFNALMLLFGYLAETKIISYLISIPIGFIFFFYTFHLLHENFAQHTEEGMKLFIFMFSIWSLYGVASVFSTNLKNLSYNILDIISKNFYGLFLFYKLWQIKL